MHAIVRRRRVSQAREEAADIEGRPVDADDPEQELARAELRAAVALAIDSLDPASASAIRALLGEAASLSVSPGAQRKRVSRAYARLRDLLGRFHER